MLFLKLYGRNGSKSQFPQLSNGVTALWSACEDWASTEAVWAGHTGGPLAVVGVLTRSLLPAGLAPSTAQDNKTYTSILYGNGPGGSFALLGISRPNVSDSQSSERPGSAGWSAGVGGGARWRTRGRGRQPPRRP